MYSFSTFLSEYDSVDDADALSDDAVQVDEDAAAEQPVDLVLARRVAPISRLTAVGS